MKHYLSRMKLAVVAALSLGLISAGVITPVQAGPRDRTLIIHYYRTTLNALGTAANDFCDEDPCDIYDGWNFWIWQSGASDSSGNDGFLFDAERDSFGAKATIPVTNPVSTKVGFLVRIGSNWGNAKADVPDDRFIDMKPTGTTEAWIKQDDPVVYYSNPNDRVLRIHYARSDNKYTGWDIQTQETDAANNKAYAFSAKSDCFGRVASIAIPDVLQEKQDFILRNGGDALTMKSVKLHAELSPKHFTDVWIQADLIGEYDAITEDGFLTVSANSDNPYGNLLQVHYNRPLQDYAGWKMFTLGDGRDNALTLSDDFGRVGCAYVVDRTLTSAVIQIRKGTTLDLAPGEKPVGLGGQRTIVIDGAVNEVWIKQGNKTVYDKLTVPDPAIRNSQSIGKMPSSLKKGKSFALPTKTNRKLAVKWIVITSNVCKVSKGKLIAKSAGTCKINVSQAGNAANKALTSQYRITIK